MTAPGRSTRRLRADELDDRRLDADRARPAVEHHVDVVSESARTASAVVGLTWPKRFADGAASPPPNAASSSSASGAAGTRRPTVSRPPVTSSTHVRAARRSTIVRGPGQKRRREHASLVGDVDRPLVEQPRRREMDDHRMVDAVDPSPRSSRRSAVGFDGVSAEAVDGLGRERDQPARAEHLDRALDVR